jgi:hypothetical protein
MGTLRKSLISRRRTRKKKLGKLRRLFVQAKTQEEKDKVLAKLFKIAPHIRKEEFIAGIKRYANKG